MLLDEILAAWDSAIGRVARKRDDPTDQEIDAATAEVCAKCGVTVDDIRYALRIDAEDLRGEVTSLDRQLQVLKAMAANENEEGTLPGLPGGPPLKH